MALSAPQIATVWKDFSDELYRGPSAPACKFTKADLSAAASATDAWIEANQAAFVAALPLPFRTTSTAAEKAALFMWVMTHRSRG